MIELARIVASGKIKSDLHSVKDNISYWNSRNQLGLTNLRERAGAATWHLANCILAVREMQASVSEIMLIVAYRQPDYQWFVGLQPDDAARTLWNQVVLFVSSELGDASIDRLERPDPRMRSTMAELAEGDTSAYERLAHLAESARAPKDTSTSERAPVISASFLQGQIEEARAFKREQEALKDLTPSQLADAFWKMIPAPRLPGISRRRAPVTLDPLPRRNARKKGILPGVETMKRYYPDYSPETAKEILNALPEAWEEYEAKGGRWGPKVIAKHMRGTTRGTVSHYLGAFRKVGLRQWGSIKLP